MDQFVVSARKYRPDTFSSVVGQDHIKETLKNAIKSAHLAQAFLFSGPRGVGKTTCARILAKTVNCFNRTESIEACDECESCKSFNEGHSLNIYELDAASNNGVEDIRNLIDQVRFAPQIGSKKVYIIDEIHMLSSAAFNAFLKTLEEPPPHAMFILATTERHKIIPTILSRCQIFDFNRIEIDDMIRSLATIAKKENVKAENDALHLISQKSDGSLRDALSMFDQMVTFSGNDLTYASVIENLSILSTDYFFNLTNHLVNNDLSSSLNLFDEVLHKGFEGHHFLLGLAEHMRNLLVAQDHGTIKLLTVGPQIKEKYINQTHIVSSTFLIKSLNLISQADLNYKSARNQRLLVELCLINMGSLKAKTTENTQPLKTTIPTNPEVKKKHIELKAPVPKIETEVKLPEEKVIDPIIKHPEASTKEIEKPVEVQEQIKNKEEEIEVTNSGQQNKEDRNEVEITDSKSNASDSKSSNEIVKDKVENHINSKKRFHDNLISDSISINAYTSANEEVIESEDATEQIVKYKENVSQEKLLESWKKMAEKFKVDGRRMLCATLSKYPPVIEGNNIEITYDNKSQAEAIIKEKSNILEKIREELKNDLLQLKLVISDHKYQRAYTDHEKLEKMIEKNPNINLLKDKLGLDLS